MHKCIVVRVPCVLIVRSEVGATCGGPKCGIPSMWGGAGWAPQLGSVAAVCPAWSAGPGGRWDVVRVSCVSIVRSEGGASRGGPKCGIPYMWGGAEWAP